MSLASDPKLLNNDNPRRSGYIDKQEADRQCERGEGL